LRLILVVATLTTSQGDIGLEMDNGKAPCTVNNFTSLARQGFFDKHQMPPADRHTRTRRAAVR